MTGLEIFVTAVISIGVGVSAGVLRHIARGPQPIPDDHPTIAGIAAQLSLTIDRSDRDFQLTKVNSGYTVLICISKHGKGAHTVVTVPLQAAHDVPFLIDQRSPNRPAGASLGIADLDEHLQVRSPTLHTGDDFSWLTGQMVNMQMAQMAELAPMFADEEFGLRLHSLVPEERNRSYINAQQVHLEEPSDDPNDIKNMIQDAVHLAQSIDLASDAGWTSVAKQNKLELSAFEENGHRRMSGLFIPETNQKIHIFVEDNEEDSITKIHFNAGLPRSLNLQSRQPDDTDNKLGNPLLDMHVRAVDLPTNFKPKICDPNLTPSLMAIFHPYPLSMVMAGKICISIKGKPDLIEMNTAIEATKELALALREAFENEISQIQ